MTYTKVWIKWWCLQWEEKYGERHRSADTQYNAVHEHAALFQNLRKTCDTMLSVIQYQKKMNTHQHLLEY